MLRDQSLVPAEALRLAALGILAEAPRRYGDLAVEVRHFASHIVGPSLELTGTSLELLRYEGLIEAIQGHGAPDNPELGLTASGRAVLAELLRASLRGPGTQFNRLLLALKLRFLHLVPVAVQSEQIRSIDGWYRSELDRIEELRRHHLAGPRLFLDWLDHQAGEIRALLEWLNRAPPVSGGAGGEGP